MADQQQLRAVYGAFLAGTECVLNAGKLKQMKKLFRTNKERWPTLGDDLDYDKLMYASTTMCMRSWLKLSPKTYDDMCMLFVMFIDRHIPGTPLYGLPTLTSDINPKIVANLRAINLAGMITIDSQPGIIDRSERQREYLMGFISHERMRALLDTLSAKKNIGFIATQQNGLQIKNCIDLEPLPPNTVRQSEHREIPLTLETNDDGGYKIFSSIRMDNDTMFDKDIKNLLLYTSSLDLVHWCSENLCHIFVYAKRWGTNGTLTKVIRRTLDAQR
jgi:hypothetical protein